MNEFDIDHVKHKIAEIKISRNDPEVAHTMEDDLYKDFIYYVSNEEDKDINDLRELAKVILTTRNISFPRWCA